MKQTRRRIAYIPKNDKDYEQRNAFFNAAEKELSTNGLLIHQAHDNDLRPEMWMNKAFKPLARTYHYEHATVTLGNMHHYTNGGSYPALEFTAANHHLFQTTKAFFNALSLFNKEYAKQTTYETKDDPPVEPFYTLPIIDIPFRPATHDVLVSADIHTLEDLLTTTNNHLLSIRRQRSQKTAGEGNFVRELKNKLLDIHPALYVGMRLGTTKIEQVVEEIHAYAQEHSGSVSALDPTTILTVLEPITPPKRK